MANATWQPGIPPEDWDEHRIKLNGHFLQSRSWAQFQIALGRQTFYASGSGWSWLAILESNRFGSRLYTPYGPSASSSASLEKATTVLINCAKTQGVDFVRIEPQSIKLASSLAKFGAQRAHRDIQPQNTLVKDLDRPDDELFAEMASTNRRLYRRAKEAGLEFAKSYDPSDLKIFLNMTHELAARTGIVTHADRYFRTMAETLLPQKSAAIFIASHDGSPVATSLVFEDTTTRYYAHAAAPTSARKLQPGVYLLGHIIFDAKAQGKHFLDYCGVAPPNAQGHKLAGVSMFKRNFGGREVQYSGTWEIPIKKTRYRALRLVRHAQRINRLLQK
jgi:lipid II:glycine glycyltransferase (peptidoglycan interpeptide bridge formation enzyme)